MIIVSNTSPIINLAATSNLFIIQKLYSQITISQAVYDEIVVGGLGLPGSAEVQSEQWVSKVVVQNKNLVKALELELDSGEAETIALALELGAGIVLMDEKNGRKVAKRFNLRTVGILGVLIEAKQNSIITSIKPIMDSLIATAGFWIAPKLYSQVLQSVGEVP